MLFFEDDIYHIYNRGNNRQQVFFHRDHYFRFLVLMRKHILPCADLLSWCLMPNHFHFLIHANAHTVQWVRDDSFPRQRLSQGVKQLLSAYTKKVNREMDFTGSRFQQKTKSKNVSDPGDYAWIAFRYIHQNPYRSGLVSKLEHWPFSSFREYLGMDRLTLCNKQLAVERLGLDMKRFYEDSYAQLDEDQKVQIFKP